MEMPRRGSTRIMQSRKWKAFLRLQGETLVDNDEDILNEFSGFVQQLKRVGVEYSIIVNVEGGDTSLVDGIERIQTVVHGQTPGKRYSKEFRS